MKYKISLKKNCEGNLSFIIVVLGFIDLLSEQIHDILKWVMMALGLVLLVRLYLRHKISTKSTMVILAAAIIVMIELLLSEGILATQYIWDLSICMPTALGIVYSQQVRGQKWMILYLISTVFLVFRMITVPDHYTILYSHSRNYISVFQLFLLFLMAIIAYKNETRLPNWVYYFSAIVCVVAVGRGGILASFLILGLHIIEDLREEKRYNKKVSKLVILLVCVAVLFVIFALFHECLIEKLFPRFSNSGILADSADIARNKRILMWGTYINQCLHSLKLFLLGTDTSPIVLQIHYKVDFNIHNSYLMTHAFYGIAGFIIVIVYSIKFVKMLIKSQGTEIVIIFIGYMFRAIFDHCFPGKLSAIVIWMVVFYGSNNGASLLQRKGI